MRTAILLWTMDCGVCASEKISIGLLCEKSREHSRAFIFNWIFFVLAGNEDMHESLDEIEFQQICNRVMALD